MAIPNLRTDTKGNRGGKRGKPSISLPTQSLDDKALHIDVPYRPEDRSFELPDYFSPHPRFADYLLIKQEPYVGDDNTLYVRQTFQKLPGVKLKTVNAIDPEGMGAVSTSERWLDRADATLPTADYKTLSLTKQDIDANTSIVEKKTVDEFPVLVGTNTDTQTGIVVEFEKTIVAAGTKGGLSGGWYTEVNPLDRLRSIQIASKIDLGSLPSPKTWKHTVQKSFPAVLIDQYFICYIANDGLRADSSIPFRCDLKEAFSASCEAETVRTYLSSAPTGTEKETPFNAQSHQIRVAAVGSNGNLIESTGVIPACLHGALSERWGSFKVGTGWQGVGSSRPTPVASTACFVTPFDANPIPATSPSGLTSGASFTHAVGVEEWRFGIWIKEVTTAKIP